LRNCATARSEWLQRHAEAGSSGLAGLGPRITRAPASERGRERAREQSTNSRSRMARQVERTEWIPLRPTRGDRDNRLRALRPEPGSQATGYEPFDQNQAASHRGRGQLVHLHRTRFVSTEARNLSTKSARRARLGGACPPGATVFRGVSTLQGVQDYFAHKKTPTLQCLRMTFSLRITFEPPSIHALVVGALVFKEPCMKSVCLPLTNWASLQPVSCALFTLHQLGIRAVGECACVGMSACGTDSRASGFLHNFSAECSQKD